MNYNASQYQEPEFVDVQNGEEFRREDYYDLFEQIEDKLTGFQILREYIKFNNFYNYFIQLFTDKADIRETGKVKVEQFRRVLTDHPSYFFTKLDIEEIIIEAPKNDDGDILYEHLAKIIRFSKDPSTSYCMVNQLCLKHFNGNQDELGDARLILSKQKANFFDNRETFDFFKHQLNLLDLEMLREDWPATKQKMLEDEDDIIDEFPNKKTAIFEERNYRRNKEMNNSFILRNFTIKLSKEIYQVTKSPDTFVAKKIVEDSQIEEQLFKAFKVKPEEATETFLFQKDLLGIFNSVRHKQLFEMNLTDDECDLFYYLMWKQYGFKIATIRTLVDFIMEQRLLSEQQLIKIQMGQDQQRRQQVKHEQVPRLFREIVKFAHQYGPSFMESTLKPLYESRHNKADLIELSNIRIYFKSLQIPFEEKEINDLKLYLSQQGIIYLDKMNQKSFLTANCYIESQKLINCIEQQNRSIANQREGEKYRQSRDEHQARNIVQASIIKGVTDRLVQKLRVYKDENNMIDEIKLRQIIADMFPEINQQHLDMIFDNLKQNTIPSKYLAQRKIYIPELASFLQSGPLFGGDMSSLNYMHTNDESKSELDSVISDSDSMQNNSELQSTSNKLRRSQISNGSSILKKSNHRVSYSKNLKQKIEEKQKQEYIKPDVQTLNVNSEAKFIIQEPEVMFTVIKNDKNKIYSEFYRHMREMLPDRLLNHLSEKDILSKSCLDLKKMLAKQDLGDGVIRVSQLQRFIQDTFHKMEINDQNYIVSQAVEHCSIGDTKLAQPVNNQQTIIDRRVQRDRDGHVIKRIPEGTHPNDEEISYSWFVMLVQTEIAQIMSISF